MIVGVGIDACPISRIDAALARFGERFERRVFTDGERAYARSRALPAQHFAARFAAKEAGMKALGVPVGWQDIEVVTHGVLRLAGKAQAVAASRGAGRAHLSMTHAADLAVAVVVLEGTGPSATSIDET